MVEILLLEQILFGILQAFRCGSTVLSEILISKCKCGPVEFPVLPTSAISCPCVTLSPCFTYKLLQCA